MEMSSRSTASSRLRSPSKTLSELIQQLFPPNTPKAVISSHYTSAIQLLSNSASSSARNSTLPVSEISIADKIKKRLVREGRESDAVEFQHLVQRLQNSKVLNRRDSILSLFLHLHDPQRCPRPEPKFKKVAPFLVHDRLQSTEVNSNHSANSSRNDPQADFNQSYLSSIHDIRHQIEPSAKGYHPPLPPKPSSPYVSLRKSQSVTDVTTSASMPKDLPSSIASEKKLLRELVFCFQGIEGVQIKQSHVSDCFVIAETFRKTYSPSVVQASLKLAELGWMFNKVDVFCKRLSEKKENGLISQSLVAAMRNELSDFYNLFASIEAQIQVPESNFSLLKLSTLSIQSFNRMKLLVSIVEACDRLKGGAILSTIYDFLDHGDDASSKTVKAILCTVCKPMYMMLLRWICDGALEDPYEEFFVAANSRVHGDQLWHAKYSIRDSMIPKFLSMTWVKKILATGKNINFLHEVCHDNSAISGRDIIKSTLNETCPENLFIHPGCDNVLHSTIQRAFTETSSHVLGILFTRYKFLDHISAMRKYLLLGQGDIIRYLLQLLEHELCQPATTLYPHNLAGILETAIRATNAQYEDPDILDRLDVRLLDIQPGDTGWDVFSLDYKVVGPIGTVLRPDTMKKYLQLFNALWRAKRMEWMLSCVWKQQAALHKMCRTVPELKPLLHIANLLTSEMVHFIHQLAYYITFEVMECSWDILIKHLRKAGSLDEVIEAQEEFLLTLLKQSLLDDSSWDLLTQLRAIYDRIIEFKGIQDKIYTAGVEEVESRNTYDLRIRIRKRQKEYGVTASEEDQEKARIDTFNRIILCDLKAQLKIVSQSYQDMVRTFLLQLASSPDQALQFLSFRLDFNQHYKRKDARLGTPLTFRHKRESMITTSIYA